RNWPMPQIRCTRALTRIRNGALRYSIASPDRTGVGSADATAAECTTGVRIAPMGARWNTLADNACSHHIPSLAPAVALPAPRHDRRRTGAAGSPPGGFPFLELTSRGCGMHVRLRPVARVGLRYRLRPAPHKTPLIPAQAGIQGPGLGPRFRGDERR